MNSIFNIYFYFKSKKKTKPESPAFGHSAKGSDDIVVLNRPLIYMDDELNNADCAESQEPLTSRMDDTKRKHSDSDNIFFTPRQQTQSIDSNKFNKAR